MRANFVYPWRSLGWWLCLCALFATSGEAAFERVSLGARPLGMASAFTAVADDVNALQWNPAGLMRVRSRQLDLSYLDLYGLVGYSAVSLVFPRKSGGYGLGIVGSSDVDGLYQELEMLVAGAYPLTDQISAGITLRYLSSRAQMGDIQIGQSSGVGVDTGVQGTLLDGRLQIALTFPNLLSQVRYHRESLWRGPETRYHESAAREARFGLAWYTDWVRPTCFTSELTNAASWRVGLESRVGRGLLLRTGFQIGGGIARNWAFGLGYTIGTFQLDYAYVLGRFNTTMSQMSLRLYY